jgi:hypothetical protein
MSPKPNSAADDDLRAEYDFRGGVRGKYFERYQQGTNVVLLDPDVAAVFRDRAAVNDALRAFVAVADAKVAASARAAATRYNKPLQPTSRAKRPVKKRQSSRAARG